MKYVPPFMCIRWYDCPLNCCFDVIRATVNLWLPLPCNLPVYSAKKFLIMMSTWRCLASLWLLLNNAYSSCYRQCLKSYHHLCVEKDDTFLTSEDSWTCRKWTNIHHFTVPFPSGPNGKVDMHASSWFICENYAHTYIILPIDLWRIKRNISVCCSILKFITSFQEEKLKKNVLILWFW